MLRFSKIRRLTEHHLLIPVFSCVAASLSPLRAVPGVADSGSAVTDSCCSCFLADRWARGQTLVRPEKRILHASVCCHSHFTQLSVTANVVDVISCSPRFAVEVCTDPLLGRSQTAGRQAGRRGGRDGGENGFCEGYKHEDSEPGNEVRGEKKEQWPATLDLSAG